MSGCPTCDGYDPLDGRLPVCQCGSQWGKDAKKGGLTRTKGLAPGKGFGERKPMNRGKPMARSASPAGQQAAMSRSATKAKPRAPRVADEVSALVLARAGGRCEAGATTECRARGRSLTSVVGASKQHRRPAQMGGSKRAETHGPANLLMVCGSGTTGCHGHMESERTAALAAGWLVPQGVDPGSVPVLLWDGRRVLLDDRGGYVDQRASA